MKKYLATFEGNCADEFDLSGIQVWDEDDVDNFITSVKKHFKNNSDLEIYFGANEFINWNSAADVINSVTLTEISDSEANTLTKLFSDGHILTWPGYFPDFFDAMNDADIAISDWEDEEDNEDDEGVDW